MKTCTKCGLYKKASEFPKDKQKRSGRYSSCKTCVNARVSAFHQSPAGRAYTKEYRQTEVYRAKKKRYYQRPNGKQTAERAWRKAYKDHRDRWYARCYLNQSIRSGKIEPARSKPCTYADQSCSGPMQYHHHLGYARESWYAVIPVCRSHHYRLTNHQLEEASR